MPEKPDDPALFALFNEIGIIGQLATTMFERVMPHDLTVAQFSVLNHLSRRDDHQAPAKMANAFQVSKGTMTSTIGRLESKGFVAVTPNPKDGRGKFVGITETGLAARNDAVAALGPDLAWLSDQTASHDISGLTQNLTTIRKLLDARRDG
ncbi:MAG: MarR family winged helix-turn-helix transcriptional regulator [Hyphomicrobiales bacterium]